MPRPLSFPVTPSRDRTLIIGGPSSDERTNRHAVERSGEPSTSRHPGAAPDISVHDLDMVPVISSPLTLSSPTTSPLLLYAREIVLLLNGLYQPVAAGTGPDLR